MTRLEFWPDYGRGPLWNDDGQHVELDSLAISPGLAARVRLWNSAYAEDKLPLDGSGDAGWLAQGVELLLQLRTEVCDGVHIQVTEPWWGEAPS
ncbi:hypothetical protein [Paenarthrobacter sp. NPDC058040]|uniref:hypothetical protein n=1 Tax=unclassified Paenarthrobacter TaxID=2634190 RepID=UPI0036DDAFDA